jgi:hypothetical protein
MDLQRPGAAGTVQLAQVNLGVVQWRFLAHCNEVSAVELYRELSTPIQLGKI